MNQKQKNTNISCVTMDEPNQQTHARCKGQSGELDVFVKHFRKKEGDIIRNTKPLWPKMGLFQRS